jgi:hypothetical protein
MSGTALNSEPKSPKKGPFTGEDGRTPEAQFTVSQSRK